MADLVFGYKRDLLERPEPDGSVSDWIARDKDAKDLLPRLTMKVGAGDIDLRPYCTDTSQLGLEACAGNSTADSVEIVSAVNEEANALLEDRPQRELPQLSRLFVYAMARTLMGELDQDNGTYIRACFEVLSTFGICTEEQWAYDQSKVFVSPSLLAQRQAVGHKIHSYYRIKDGDQERLDMIVGALRSKHPVVFGTLITPDFMALGGAAVVDRPAEGAKTAGGHAMVIVGMIGDKFLVKNSWGRNWRDGGYVLMTPEYLTWENTWDLWVPTLGTDFGG
jgi:hypothetical protein